MKRARPPHRVVASTASSIRVWRSARSLMASRAAVGVRLAIKADLHGGDGYVFGFVASQMT